MFAEAADLFDKVTNFGGLGVAVWILYVLHTKSTNSFREEMKIERDRSDKRLSEERELWKEAIEAIVGRLDHIENKLDEIATPKRRVACDQRETK